jgi:DNA sulfur modification protein DndD
MILDKVILEDFGAYGGRQEALLTPDYGKPVILFGGMNGGGKTTFLDSIQLGFYGQKAKTSNRGNMGYNDYLAECIHREVNPGKGASITIEYHRMSEGRATRYELRRSWRRGPRGIRETLQVRKDGRPDEYLTDHWDETIEAYLPADIAHLFFFDGEQIKELAEGQNAARIIGTAINSLLGLDLVDRLENDLRIFKRRKKEETLDHEFLRRLKLVKEEFEHLDEELGRLRQQEGGLRTEKSNIERELAKAKDNFEREGGELFLRHDELEKELTDRKQEREALWESLRLLAADALPLLLVKEQLAEIQSQAQHETSIRHNRLLVDVLEERDEMILSLLRDKRFSADATIAVAQELEADRNQRRAEAEEELIIDAEQGYETALMHLRQNTLPSTHQNAKELLSEALRLDERIARLEADLARVPDEDRIKATHQTLLDLQNQSKEVCEQLEALYIRLESVTAQHVRAAQQVDQFGLEEIELRSSEDSLSRFQKHSDKVRKTLVEFKTRIIRKNAAEIEALMLESFQSLLRKPGLISGLSIDPTTFAVTLLDRAGKPLPFDRLSAGERQLLATSLLWGLAKASGRPIPTIIDTPLGRLDSSHRRHLTERYFPHASHQVLLLSTDEEIVGKYLHAIEPFMTRSYHLAHNEALGSTSINPGYFPEHESAH